MVLVKKSRNLNWIIISLMLSFFPVVTHSQDYHSEFYSLKSSVDNIEAGILSKNIALPYREIKNLKEKVNNLKDIYDHQNIILDKNYLKSLKFDINLLNSVLVEKSSEASKEMFSIAYKDIEIKHKFAISQMGFAGAPSDFVKLTVTTKHANREVSGFLIRLNPVRWADAEFMILFNKESSPTVEKVPPGRYQIMAVQGNDNMIIAKKIIDIGISGNDFQNIDINIP